MSALSIGIVVLAAGASSRMKGQPKQLLEFEGKSLLRRAAETCLNTNRETVVVLGANFETARREISDLEPPLHIVVNGNWSNGIGASIKAGLSALIDKNLDAVVVALCDQPFVTRKTIERLTEAFEKTEKAIAASCYRNTIGVPAVFGRQIFDELLNLPDDAGAKFLFEKYQEMVVTISIPEAAFDVDTPEDYEKLKTPNIR